MGKEMRVTIPEDLSLNIERLFYEYTAGMQSVAFLTKDKDVPMDILKWKIDHTETVCAELEMLKNATAKKYLPDYIRVSRKDYGFEFMFDTSEIVYTFLEG